MTYESAFAKFSLHFMSHKLLVINKLFLKRKRRNTFSLNSKEIIFESC